MAVFVHLPHLPFVPCCKIEAPRLSTLRPLLRGQCYLLIRYMDFEVKLEEQVVCLENAFISLQPWEVWT